jgi:hypothetical protein
VFLNVGLMITVHLIIKPKLKRRGRISRSPLWISADYGRVEVAKSLTSSEDLFGPTINLCKK